MSQRLAPLHPSNDAVEIIHELASYAHQNGLTLASDALVELLAVLAQSASATH
ncbi:hypothetical protein ACQW02_26010 [Humitalea sp. 24SJ18S-53]|uniref:hypothetical protein n=1 Tax=Humitalea sp. 24SJ18S-53 TaxID=3422307 RepID=UPI003D67C397